MKSLILSLVAVFGLLLCTSNVFAVGSIDVAATVTEAGGLYDLDAVIDCDLEYPAQNKISVWVIVDDETYDVTMYREQAGTLESVSEVGSEVYTAPTTSANGASTFNIHYGATFVYGDVITVKVGLKNGSTEIFKTSAPVTCD